MERRTTKDCYLADAEHLLVRVSSERSNGARIIGFLVGLVYAAIYLVLAFGVAGAGHGTGIFFAAILPAGFYLVGQLAIWAGLIRTMVMRGAPPNKALQLTAR